MISAGALVVNSIYPENSTIMIGIAILIASVALFIALLAEVLTLNIVNAVVNKDRADQVSLLSAVIGKTLYKVIADEKAKDNK